MVGGEGYEKAILGELVIIIGGASAIIITIGIGINMYVNMYKTV